MLLLAGSVGIETDKFGAILLGCTTVDLLASTTANRRGNYFKKNQYFDGLALNRR